MHTKHFDIAIVVLASLWAGSARPDSQFEADRVYCRSSADRERRALCLREAGVAQAARKHAGASSPSGMKPRDEDQKQRTDSEKVRGERSRDDARKARGSMSPLPQAIGRVPIHAAEPDMAPAPHGK